MECRICTICISEKLINIFYNIYKEYKVCNIKKGLNRYFAHNQKYRNNKNLI